MKRILMAFIILITIGVFMGFAPFFVEADKQIVQKEVIDIIINQEFDIQNFISDNSSIVKCESSNKRNVQVKNNGILIGKKISSATLTLIDGNGNKNNVVINVKKECEKLKINNEEIQLYVNDNYKIIGIVEPIDSCTSLLFNSSNEEIVSVDTKGNLNCKKAGKATITVTTLNGINKQCVVTVVDKETKVNFSDNKEVTLYIDESITRQANASNPEQIVNYYSLNPDIATVDSKGKIIGNAPGVGYIIAQCNDEKDILRVNVVNTKFYVPINNIPLMLGKHYDATTKLSTNLANVKVIYKSTNENVVTVNDKGRIEAVGIGEAMVYMYTSDGQASQYYRCIVSDKYFSYGIDISKWQGKMSVDNWRKVKEDQVDFALLRIGNSFTIDEQFFNYYKNCKEVGIDVGVYHWVNCTTVQQAIDEANWCVNKLKENNVKLEYPVLMDFETADQKALSPSQQKELIDAYCDVIRKNGYCVGVYGYANMMKQIDHKVFEKYGQDDYLALAIAHYGAIKPGGENYDEKITIWQYTSGGKIDGIRTRCDLDLCFFDYPSYIKENHLSGY